MYIVLEIQEEQDGRTRVLEPAFFEEKEDALQKYYIVLSYAVKSELAKHTAMIVTPDGQVFKSECYMFTPEPEPAPEPEPTPEPEPEEDEPVEEEPAEETEDEEDEGLDN